MSEQIIESLKNDIKNTYPLDDSFKEVRKKALEDLSELGLPTRKVEEWKFTNPQAKLDRKYLWPTVSYIGLNSDLELNEILLKDGKLSHGQLEEGFELLVHTDFSTLPKKGAIHTKLSETNHNRPFLSVSQLAPFPVVATTILKELKTPINLKIEVSSGHAIAPMFFWNFGPRAEVTIMEEHNLAENAWWNGQSFIDIDKNAHVHHSLAQLNTNGLYTGHISAEVAENATYNAFALHLGTGQSRLETEINLNGEGAHTNSHGLYALKDNGHADCHGPIHHKASHTTASQLYKGLLAHSSRGVFSGKIYIHKDAQQVNSEQLNNNLLLSPKAHVDTRPQLEVYADDVKCAHGATIGQLDDEHAFYLETRGIPRLRAKKLLCMAYARDILNEIANEKIRGHFQSLVQEQFFPYVEL